MSKTLDIAIRVSRVGHRDEARMYTVENQEDACRRLIASKGYGVGEVVSEVNVSGGKAAAKRGIEKLIQRVERGESAGVVVYDWSRFSREEPFPAVMAVGRIHQAGGVMYGVADNYDSSGPLAVLQTAMYATMAHDHLKVARERTAAGRAKAKERGAYLGKTPRGYVRNDDGSISAGPDAVIVQEIFDRKLRGESYSEIAKHAQSQGMKITRDGVRSILANPVYIGQSTAGEARAMIEVETFRRAQETPNFRTAKGQGAKTMSQGLAVCANCGSTLIVHRTGRDGTLSYYCRGYALRGCEDRGCVKCELLDHYVEEQFLAAFRQGGPLFKAFYDSESLAETKKQLDEARASYEALKANTALLVALEDDAADVVAKARGDVDAAELAYTRANLHADDLHATASVLTVWHSLNLVEKRFLLRSGIDRIEVGNGRVPVAQKARIIFKGNVVTGTPDDAGPNLPVVEDGHKGLSNDLAEVHD